MSDHERDEVLKKDSQQGAVSCEICLQEVPASVTNIFEYDDYVRYFCGLECYDEWGKARQQIEKSKA